jgi:DNA polymerase-1
MAASKTLYLVDGTSQLFRAYFAIRGLTNADGLPTNAVYGFTTMLRKLIRDHAPRYLAVAFDVGAATFRHEEYREYKANRPDTPEDLGVQMPYARQVCEALRIPVLERENYEADDLIATLTRKARSAGFDVIVVAADKDLLQLVGDGVRVLNPARDELLDAEGVAATFGVPPERVVDVQGLMGDAVDNIPGVRGVGEKTAKAIVSTYGDLDRVLRRAERFVAAYDTRDRLAQRLAALERDGTLAAEAAEDVAEQAQAMSDRLDELAEAEADAELRGRFADVASALRGPLLAELRAAIGRPGKDAAARLRAVSKLVRELDRGSARRIWYAIHEHAEQARLSRRLATLCEDSPIEFEPPSLALGPPDRARLEALFQALGFRSLIQEASPPAAAVAAAEVPRDAPLGGRYETADTVDAVKGLVEACRREGRLALHVEARGEDPLRASLDGIGVSCAEGQGAYIPLAAAAAGTRDLLARLLGDPEVGKSGHDIKRQQHILSRHGLPVSGWLLDISVGAFLLNTSREAYDLPGLAQEFLGLAPAALAAAPAAALSAVTFRLGEALEARLAGAGVLELYRTIDGPLLPVLARMEARGIRVDAGKLRAMAGEMRDALELLRLEIHALAGVEFNVDSPRQLREVLFERLGLRPRRKTEKEKLASTDAQTLEELAGEHEIARKILEYRELAKLKGTYVDTLPQLVRPDTGRIHTRYNPMGAATGRLSSSDPNLQNIPARTPAGRRIRAAFVPEPGWVFVASDYSQIELRVLAHLSRDPELARAVREGEDIHRHTAARVAGVLPEMVTEEMRRRAKAINFGILYGMSETRLAREQGLTRLEARVFIDTYFRRFPAVRAYVDETRDRARREGAVRTLFGRVRYFPQLHQRVHRAVQEQSLRAAVNTTIQGTAADLMKLAMLRVDEALAKAGLNTQILLQVHDELLLEAPEPEAASAKDLIRRAMEGVPGLDVPLVVDQKVGDSWEAVT